MAKLHFYYSAMNAGKSTVLLQSSYNYQERGIATLLFAPLIDTRYGVGRVTSRIGLTAPAICFNAETNLFQITQKKLLEDPSLGCVLVDEAHFLNKEHVWQLCQICDELNIPVLTYGLRSDFRGEPFEGSKYLLILADQLIEIKTICHCGKKATMNMRIDEAGKPVKEGAQVEIAGNERYIATCRKHFGQEVPLIQRVKF